MKIFRSSSRTSRATGRLTTNGCGPRRRQAGGRTARSTASSTRAVVLKLPVLFSIRALADGPAGPTHEPAQVTKARHSQPRGEAPMTGHASPPGSAWSEDARWLAVFAAATLVELAWWAAAWGAGLAPVPLIGTYSRAGFGRPYPGAGVEGGVGDVSDPQGLAAPFSPRRRWSRSEQASFCRSNISFRAKCRFGSMRRSRRLERALFGADPWLLLDRLLGWADVPDRPPLRIVAAASDLGPVPA